MKTKVAMFLILIFVWLKSDMMPFEEAKWPQEEMSGGNTAPISQNDAYLAAIVVIEEDHNGDLMVRIASYGILY